MHTPWEHVHESPQAYNQEVANGSEKRYPRNAYTPQLLSGVTRMSGGAYSTQYRPSDTTEC